MTASKFQTNVDITAIPEDGSVMVRVADNVLDPEHWSNRILYLQSGRVVDEGVMGDSGVYEMPEFIGMNVYELMKWTSHDSTGDHPETYHELAVMRAN